MDVIGWIDTARKDLRYASRVLRKTPAFSFTAVLAIALGIGSTTLMFSVLNSLLLQPPPYHQADRLYMVWQRLRSGERASFSTRDFLAWKQQTESFEDLAAFTGSGFTISGVGEPQLAIGQMVTPSFFHILGVQPKVGRVFTPSEGNTGRDREVILGYQLWRDKFGARGDVIGQSVVMNAQPYSIVGVMPQDFDFPGRDYKLWVPAALNGPLFQQHLDAHFLRVLGRVKPGIDSPRLQSEIDVIGKRLGQIDSDPARRYFAISLREALNGDLR